MPAHNGRSALVTGAGSGIGRGIAHRLAAEGAKVAVLDVDAQTADEVATSIRSAGGEAAPVVADVRDRDAVRRAVGAAVDAFGGLDLLVNNAGVVIYGEVPDYAEQDWDTVVGTNLKGQFLMCKYAIPRISQRGGGAIVNMASVAGLVGLRNRAAYCASKGAVIAFTRALAVDHVADGVRVNAVCPGTVDSPWVRRLVEEVGESLDALRARQPMGRLGQTDEIAEAVLYLASDAAAFVTGTALVIDGGLTAA
jgi:NAD(P)-dependent dehydrogenase (short-subunit alcohol dehydrogenase family)